MAKKPDVLEQIERERVRKDHERALAALRVTLSTEEGKVALWHIVRMTGFFADRVLDSSSMIYANAALRDFGKTLLTLLVNANEQAVFDLQRAEWHRAVEERIEDNKLLQKESD